MCTLTMINKLKLAFGGKDLDNPDINDLWLGFACIQALQTKVR